MISAHLAISIPVRTNAHDLVAVRITEFCRDANGEVAERSGNYRYTADGNLYPVAAEDMSAILIEERGSRPAST